MDISNETQNSSQESAQSSFKIRFLYFYFILFGADAFLSVANDLFAYVGVDFLSPMRNLLAAVTLLLVIPYSYSLFSIRPKWRKFFLSVPLFLFCGVLFALISTLYFINISSPGDLLTLSFNPKSLVSKYSFVYFLWTLISISQLTLFLFISKPVSIILKYSKNHVAEEKSNFMDLAMASMMGFSIPSFYLASQAIILVSMFVLGPKGFISIDEDSLLGVEKIYKNKEGKIVRLIPMIHVGDKTYYNEVSKIDGKEKTLVVLEGVHDDTDELKGLSYEGVADGLGLNQQADHFKPKSSKEDLQENIVYIRESMKTSEMRKETISMLKKALGSMNNKKSFSEILTAGNANITKEEFEAFVEDVLDARSNDVLRIFDQHQKNFTSFVIPWGALHMPDIEKGMVERGFKMEEKIPRKIISFSEMRKKFEEKKKSRIPASTPDE